MVMMMRIKKLLWLVWLALSAVLARASTLTVNDVCTPKSAGNSSIDDVPNINIAVERCGDGGTILIPAGQTYMIRSRLDFNYCYGCRFQIDGTLKVSDDLDYWEGKTAFFVQPYGYGATFFSSTGSGLIDGSGQAYWDHFATNKTYRRPFLIQISNGNGITFTNITLKNAPFWFFFVTDNSANITLSNLVLSAVSTSENRPANTDGFDTGDCSDVTITNVHVTNGDDCVSFKNGSNNITVNNITCVGSHGISVGSLGSDRGHPDAVQNVYVSNAKMINCTTATRIKFYPGGPSHGTVVVSNVTYKDITVDNCDYALQVDNCYESDPTTCKENPSAAKLVDIHFSNIIGKTSNKYDPVVARIDCPPTGTCDLTFKQWDIVTPTGNSTVLCSNYDHPSGVTCTPEV
jgi:galacturan 1,4-alpha-galacturonidase